MFGVPSLVFLAGMSLLLLCPAVSQEMIGEFDQIRLTGSQLSHEGNIEVMTRGEWRYVCDDDFGFDEADVICRQLGFEAATSFTRNNHFGINSLGHRRTPPKFWFDGVNCSSASSFSQCRSKGIGIHNCTSIEIAGVACRIEGARCQVNEFPCTGSSTCLNRSDVCDGEPHCPDGSDEDEGLCEDVGVTRLTSNTDTDIPGAALGLVYVKYKGEWGTICDDEFLFNDAKVICRSLGYSSGWSVPFTKGYLGTGEGKIWVNAPSCRGNEDWIGDCQRTRFRHQAGCTHGEDASVFCYDGGVEMRLSGEFSGQVEMRLGGQWAGVCGTAFDDLDARVICNMLGYSGDARAIPGGSRASGLKWRMTLDCTGNEKDIQNCRIRLSNSTCSSRTNAAVQCSLSEGQVDEALKSLQPECGTVEEASTRFLTRLAKVRGGTLPSRFDAPWLVSLRTSQNNFGLICGGTIISEYYVVTAAHCLRRLGRLNLVIRVGDFNSDFIEDNEEEYFIDKVWEHETFNVLSFNDNDIALLKVEPKDGRGIKFGDNVKPLCIPKTKDIYHEDLDCTVIGWGRNFIVGDVQARPLEGKVNILPDKNCEQVLTGGPKNFTSSFLCVGNIATNVNACEGDSGGPLACRMKGSDGPKYLYGVVSTGFRCGIIRAPDLLTRVTKYLTWIYDKIFPGSYRYF